MGVKVNGSGVIKGFEKLNDECRERVKKRLEDFSSEIEAEMKRRAPWQDRTGAARAGLKASLKVEDDGVFSIHLEHTVPYGIYLEFAMEKRFAVLAPTMNSVSPQLVEVLKGILY